MWKRLSRPARVFAVLGFVGSAALLAGLALLVIGVVSSPRSRQTGRLIGYDAFARPAIVIAIIGAVLMACAQIGLNTPAAYRTEDDGTKVVLRKRLADNLARRGLAGPYRDRPPDSRRRFWALQLIAVVSIAGWLLLVFGLIGASRHADSGRVVTLLTPPVLAGVVVLCSAAAITVWAIGLFRRASSPSIVVRRSSARQPLIAFAVLFALSVGALVVVDSYATSRSIGGDRLVDAFVSPPPGFAEVAPRGPEDGPQDAAQVSALYSKQQEALDFLRSTGFVAGWSRHWTNGGLETDSLVIRVYQFATSDGAHNFAAPDCCPPGQTETSTTVVSMTDARVTSAFHPNLPSSYGYLALPYAILGIGRVCDIVVTVFFRSREDVHPAPQVSDLLRAEADRVRSISNC